MATVLAPGNVGDGPYDAAVGGMHDTATRLTVGGRLRLASVTLDEVVDEFWQGWTVRAVDVAWFDVLYLVEHPIKGLGASLFSVQPYTARFGDVDKPVEEMWEILDVGRRDEHVYGVVHAHGATRVEVLNQFLNLTHTTRAERKRATVLFAMLVESDWFAGDGLRTVLSLNPAFDFRMTQAREHWVRQCDLFGLRSSRFLLGPGQPSGQPSTTHD